MPRPVRRLGRRDQFIMQDLPNTKAAGLEVGGHEDAIADAADNLQNNAKDTHG